MLSTGLGWLDTIVVVGCLGSLVWLVIEWVRKRHQPFRILGEACFAVAGLAAVGPFFGETSVLALLVAGPLTVGGSLLMLAHYRTQGDLLRRLRESRKKWDRAWAAPFMLIVGTLIVLSYLEGDSLGEAIQTIAFALGTAGGIVIGGRCCSIDSPASPSGRSRHGSCSRQACSSPPGPSRSTRWRAAPASC